MVMSLLNVDEQRTVTDAIAAVEKKTDAELIAVLARRSDHYLHLPTLWAAIVALLTPAAIALTSMQLSVWEMLIAQWLVL
jgi:putative membrane protein